MAETMTTKEERADYMREWRQKNPDAARAIDARRREKPERREYMRKYLKEYQKAWKPAYRAANREAYAQYEAKRRALKRGSAVDVVDYAAIWERDQGVCHICLTSVELGDHHFDHVVPLAAGGPHVEDNIKVAHASCNMSKGAR